ncbi:MAG: hypothetical protein GWN58_57605, partial [Anaerolineae bacterium]|nr:hypothetical protein [Anaerolineae bacterium]
IADALGAAFSDAYASEKRRAKFVCGHPQQEALMNWRCARILQTGDYEDGKVRLDNPFGADTWINPF